MASSLQLLDITSKPQFDDLLTSYKTIAHYPLASTTYGYNEDIRFQVENQNDFWLPSQSYITIEGRLIRNPNDSTVAFITNGILQLFSECKYYLNGVEIDQTRGLGFASTLKAYCSLTPDEVLSYHHAGWGDFPETVNNAGEYRFKVCIPLKFLIGFAEDYNKILLGARQELILTRTGHDKNGMHKDLPVRAAGASIMRHMP